MSSFVILDLEITKNSEQYNLKDRSVTTWIATIALQHIWTLFQFLVGKYPCSHHSSTELKQKEDKQVVKHGPEVPGGALQICLSRVSTWMPIPWVHEKLHSYQTDSCAQIEGRLVCKTDPCSWISIERSAQAHIRFSLKMLKLKCMLECQYMLTHFAELFVQYCRRVISWLLISCSFCSY